MNALYFLLLLFLPTQFGKHFWPSFSFVSGIRIDYLSPTLYFTDCLVILLFLVSVRNGFLKRILSSISKKAWIFFGLFIAELIVGILFSVDPPVGFYGLVKFLEFCFVGVFTAYYFKTEKQWRLFLIALSVGICGESFLAILQFFHGGSIGGIFYFLGERSYSGTTPGIANAVINQELILRPYGTFSHPNVLAGYLVLSLVLIYLLRNKLIQGKIFYFQIFLGSFALLLTLSRAAIFLALLMFLFFLLKKKEQIRKVKRLWAYLGIFILSCVLVGSPIITRFFQTRLTEDAIITRLYLLRDTFLMIKDHPLLGAGLMNFLPQLPHYPSVKHTLFYLQPAHNIYMLILSEVGFLGGVLIAVFIWNTVIYAAKQKNHMGIILLFLIGILGFFDHYFVTLQSGQLLLAFVLGFCWKKKTQTE